MRISAKQRRVLFYLVLSCYDLKVITLDYHKEEKLEKKG